MTNSDLKIILCTVPLGRDSQAMLRDKIADELPMAPNTAIVSLMNWMAKAGFSGECYNIDLILPSDREIYEYFSSRRPAVVGLSAVTSTMYLRAKEISNIIRRASRSTLIVLGGNLAVSASVILKKTEVDICVLGDGEIAWVEILTRVRAVGTNLRPGDLSGITGIAFLNDDGEMEFTGYGKAIPDEEHAVPDYSILCSGSNQVATSHYFKEGKNCSWFACDERAFEIDRRPNLAMIWTSKGCVGRCTFCQRFIRGYHLFNLKRLEEHMRELRDRYNVGFILINGENFGLPKEYAYSVAGLLKKYQMLWGVGAARCDSFGLEDMKYFKECGCTAIKFGIESGSQRILDIMEKRFTVDDIFAALENARKAGLYSPIGLCLGMPGENEQTIMETGRFLERVAQMAGVAPIQLPVQMTYALPLPGAPLFEYARLKGAFDSKIDEEENVLLHLSERAPSPYNYINLNGARMREALFWEYMIHFEAMRAFYRHSADRPVCNGKQSAPEVREDKARSEGTGGCLVRVLKRILRMRWKEFLLVSDKARVLINKILRNDKLTRFCLRVPRGMLYPLLREVIFLEYVGRRLAERVSSGRIGRGTFKYKRCRDHIAEARSLRAINKELKRTLPAPLSLTERNQRLLYEGR